MPRHNTHQLNATAPKSQKLSSIADLATLSSEDDDIDSKQPEFHPASVTKTQTEVENLPNTILQSPNVGNNLNNIIDTQTKVFKNHVKNAIATPFVNRIKLKQKKVRSNRDKVRLSSKKKAKPNPSQKKSKTKKKSKKKKSETLSKNIKKKNKKSKSENIKSRWDALTDDQKMEASRKQNNNRLVLLKAFENNNFVYVKGNNTFVRNILKKPKVGEYLDNLRPYNSQIFPLQQMMVHMIGCLSALITYSSTYIDEYGLPSPKIELVDEFLVFLINQMDIWPCKYVFIYIYFDKFCAFL